MPFFPEEKDCVSLGSAVGSVAGTESQEGSEYDETEEVKKGLNYFIGNQYCNGTTWSSVYSLYIVVRIGDQSQ